MSILIITAAIDTRNSQIPWTVLVNTDERLKQYLESIEYAIENYKSINTIIFCDNSNFKFDYTTLILKAKKNNKILEVLVFEGDKQNIELHGKGYGEGEIMKFVLDNSKSLVNCKSFYKLTGRLIVKNFDDVVKKTDDSSYFTFYPKEIYGTSHNYVSTVFYKVNKLIYKEYLQGAFKEVDDLNNIFLESIFCKKLINKKIAMKSFKGFPEISGISGSSGMQYDLSKKKIAFENILNYLGIHNMNQNYFSKFAIKLVSLFRRK